MALRCWHAPTGHLNWYTTLVTSANGFFSVVLFLIMREAVVRGRQKTRSDIRSNGSSTSTPRCIIFFNVSASCSCCVPYVIRWYIVITLSASHFSFAPEFIYLFSWCDITSSTVFASYPLFVNNCRIRLSSRSTPSHS